MHLEIAAYTHTHTSFIAMNAMIRNNYFRRICGGVMSTAAFFLFSSFVVSVCVCPWQPEGTWLLYHCLHLHTVAFISLCHFPSRTYGARKAKQPRALCTHAHTFKTQARIPSVCLFASSSSLCPLSIYIYFFFLFALFSVSCEEEVCQ